MLDRLPNGAKVLIIRLRSLGDCVLTTPALHLLKQFRPDLRIAVMVEDRFADVFRGNPEVAAVLQPSLSAALLWRPALTVNFHGGTRSAWLTAASAARWRAAFAHLRHQALYNLHIPRAQQILGEERTVHTVEHLASAMFWLGVPQAEIPRARLFAPTPSTAVGRPYAVIHALASAPDKTWPAERFLHIARNLKDLEPVFIGGPSDDISPFREFRLHSSRSLADTISLMRGASFFLGNDSGPAHIAAAFGVPQAVLFGTSDPVVWAPWRTESRVIAAHGPIRNIGTDQVIDAISQLGVAV